VKTAYRNFRQRFNHVACHASRQQSSVNSCFVTQYFDKSTHYSLLFWRQSISKRAVKAIMWVTWRRLQLTLADKNTIKQSSTELELQDSANPCYCCKLQPLAASTFYPNERLDNPGKSAEHSEPSASRIVNTEECHHQHQSPATTAAAAAAAVSSSCLLLQTERWTYAMFSSHAKLHFLADRTNGRAYATVLRLSVVRLSVCDVMYCG